MKALIKFFGILLAIFLLVVWFFFDNIKGYYTFKEYCEKEGGLKVYEPLEKSVGWWADDKNAARQTAGLEYVGFVRYKDNDQAVDLTVVGSKDKLTLDFLEQPADMSKSVFYQLKIESTKGEGGISPGKLSYKILSLDNKKLVEFNQFFYGFFNSEKMPMNVNQKFSCFNEYDNKNRYAKWESEINLSFSKK